MLLLLGKIRTDDAIDKMSTKLELWKNDLKLELTFHHLKNVYPQLRRKLESKLLRNIYESFDIFWHLNPTKGSKGLEWKLI